MTGNATSKSQGGTRMETADRWAGARGRLRAEKEGSSNVKECWSCFPAPSLPLENSSPEGWWCKTRQFPIVRKPTDPWYFYSR